MARLTPMELFGGEQMTTAKTFGFFFHSIAFQFNVTLWAFCVIVVLINFDPVGIWIASNLMVSD